MLIHNKILLGGVIVIFLVIISTTLYSNLISEQIRKISIERAEMDNVSFITTLAQKELSEKDFEPNNFEEKNIIFSEFFKHLENEETIRIKVWSQNGTIIYSDDPNIVGENFKENERFQVSIMGQPNSEIKEPVDPENISEVGYGQLMEIYVPIWLDSSEPLGVIELYCSLDSINESVSKVNFLIFEFTLILIGIISGAVILFAGFMVKKSREEIQKEKFATIGKLSSRVAHDLRNPLSVIKNVATLNEIKNPESQEESNKRNKMIINAVERMTHQINDVMNFVKNTKLDITETSTKKIIDSSQEHMIIPPEIKFNHEGEDLKIYGDEKLLEGLFSNLFSNSIHSMNGKGTITTQVENEKNHVVIKVIDQGPGITKENIKKIFLPLYTTKQEGTGLGLFSCKTTIEQHGGTIEFHNNPTTFTVKLPKHKNHKNTENE